MSFNQVVEQYTTYLLKLSYLNVGNRQTAEDIVKDVLIQFYEKFGDIIPLENTKSYLTMMTMNRCREYFKSWDYRKIQLLGVFSKDANRNPSHSEQDELLIAISKLPIHFREVVILYYFDDQTTTEIAKMLNRPISTVRTRLQRAHQRLDKERTLHAKLIGQALGNWDTESERVKQEIYHVTIQKQAFKAKHKHLKWRRLFATVALLMLTLGGFFMWQGDEANAPILPTEPVTPDVEIGQSEIIPHEKTLQLYKYEAFYYSGTFYSETHAESIALERVMSIYPILYHMDKYNYSFPKDREEYYRNRAASIFKSRMQEPEFKKYFELIQQKHGITEQDYIEHYFFLEEKYNYMNNQLHANFVGFVDGAYPSIEVNKEYEAILGISLDELSEKEKKEFNIKLNQKDEVENPPLIGYMNHFSDYKFVYNEKGQVIILPNILTIFEYLGGYREVYGWETNALMFVLYNYIFTYESGHEQLPIMNRLNLPEFVTLLEQFEGTAEQESLAQEAITFIRILENSVNMELENEFILPQ